MPSNMPPEFCERGMRNRWYRALLVRIALFARLSLLDLLNPGCGRRPSVLNLLSIPLTYKTGAKGRDRRHEKRDTAF